MLGHKGGDVTVDLPSCGMSSALVMGRDGGCVDVVVAAFSACKREELRVTLVVVALTAVEDGGCVPPALPLLGEDIVKEGGRVKERMASAVM